MTVEAGQIINFGGGGKPTVRISTAANGAGPVGFDNRAKFRTCGSTTEAALGPGQSYSAQCSSSNIQVVTGPVEVTFFAPDGAETTANLSTGFSLTLETENFTITVNTGTATFVVDGVPFTLSAGDPPLVVTDTTPPVITAALVQIGDIGDDDEGVFRVEFNVTDTSDPAPSVIAVLEVPGLADIPVTNGQVIEFEVDDEGSEVESEDGILEIEAPSLTLRVTGTDAAGNSAEATAAPAFGEEEEEEEE